MYNDCKSHNSDETKISKVVISGGDAIFYYIEDKNTLTKDFDMKFIYKDFQDWNQYWEEVNNNRTYPNNTNNNIVVRQMETYYNNLFNERNRFFKQCIKRFCNIEYTGNRDEKIILYDEKINISSYLLMACQDFIKLINIKKGTDYKLEKLTIEINNAPSFYNIKNQNEIPTHLYNSRNSYLEYLYTERFIPRRSLVYEIKISDIDYPIIEGLMDINTFSPLTYGMFELYRNPTTLYTGSNITDPPFDVIDVEHLSFQDSMIFKSLSYTETTDNLCIIGIDYVIWDTIRMGNWSYGEAKRLKIIIKGKEQFGTPITQEENNDLIEKLHTHKKYNKKYRTILSSLFTKLRCIEPFIEQIQRCNDKTQSFTDIILYEFKKLIRLYEPDIKLDETLPLPN